MTRVKARAEKMFGYTRDELVGAEIEQLAPCSFARHHEHRDAYLGRPSKRPMGGGLELHGRRKDDSGRRQLPAPVALSRYAAAPCRGDLSQSSMPAPRSSFKRPGGHMGVRGPSERAIDNHIHAPRGFADALAQRPLARATPDDILAY
jgi:PAS domain-containing protein